MNSRIVKTNEELESVKDFLKRNALPYQDLELSKTMAVIYEDDGCKFVGCGALEFYGNCALLRSVAVESARRGESFGKAIVADLLQRAQKHGVAEVYLLTETAREFFLRLKFQELNRDEAPAILRESSEFKTVCPASATLMRVEKF